MTKTHSDEITVIDTKANFLKFAAELNEIVAGTRGCTSISKKAAEEQGIQWGSVVMACQVRGLQLRRQGNFGYLIRK